MIKVLKGWVFYTADFSMQGSGISKTGTVMIKRDKESTELWHKVLSDEVKESDFCPQLYIQGEGETVEDAVKNANLLASHARPIN